MAEVRVKILERLKDVHPARGHVEVELSSRQGGHGVGESAVFGGEPIGILRDLSDLVFRIILRQNDRLRDLPL